MPGNDSCWLCWISCTPSTSMKIKLHPVEAGAPPRMPLAVCCEWRHPLAEGEAPGRVLCCSIMWCPKNWANGKALVFNIKRHESYYTFIFLVNYIDCDSIKFILFFGGGLFRNKLQSSFFVFVFFGKSLLPCWCSYENCVEGLEWFIAYGKICLISYRHRLETFYYIVVYILISLSFKDMYWNKYCICFISIFL